jgi:hypothetical protein
MVMETQMIACLRPDSTHKSRPRRKKFNRYAFHQRLAGRSEQYLARICSTDIHPADFIKDLLSDGRRPANQSPHQEETNMTNQVPEAYDRIVIGCARPE